MAGIFYGHLRFSFYRTHFHIVNGSATLTVKDLSLSSLNVPNSSNAVIIHTLDSSNDITVRFQTEVSSYYLQSTHSSSAQANTSVLDISLYTVGGVLATAIIMFSSILFVFCYTKKRYIRHLSNAIIVITTLCLIILDIKKNPIWMLN